MFIHIRDDHPYLNRLKQECMYNWIHLNEDLDSEVDRIKHLMKWVHEKLFYLPTGNVSKFNDPLNILKEATRDKVGFRCIEFAIVLNGLINSLGVVSRIVFLHQKRMDKLIGGGTHAVIEAYLPTFNKWVLFDPSYKKVVYFRGEPLNGYEILRNLKSLKDQYTESIAKYLCYFEVYYDNHVFITNSLVDSKKLMLITQNAKVPSVYQRLYPLVNIKYTRNYNEFYETPKIRSY